MKNVLAMLIVVTATAQAQYSIRSPYLQQPERVVPYVDSCAQFWIRVHDTTYGGFYTNVDKFGNVITAWGTNKNLVSQSRDAYGFTRAFMLTGNELYLTMARSALNFIYTNAWDTHYGGWFASLDRFGTPQNTGNNKTAFDQHYALLGIAAAFEATQDTTDRRWLLQGYEKNNDQLWDARPAYFGYYDQTARSWQNKSGKTFNATVDAITTHLLHLYLMTGEDRYRTRLLEVTQNMMTRLVPTVDSMAIGFVEKFNADWQYTNSTANFNTRTLMGHVLKTAWCLARVHELFPDTNYMRAAEKLARNVLTRGYDHDYGGPYKDYDRVTGAMFMYGQADTAKAWWQMEQAITAGLMLYYITGNTDYLRMADGSLDFFMRYFVDHVYSEVYFDRTRRGGFIWSENKGDNGKAAYHSIETGYYVYLYGNLMLHGRPATLYYKFSPEDSGRTLRMNPLAMRSSGYRIKEVRRNGDLYTQYNAAQRLLTLPPGIGGIFAVTYEPVTTSVARRAELPAVITLEQNYPNPFNPATRIAFTLPEAGATSVRVYDILGKEVATLIDARLDAGRHEVPFDASHLASGIYLYRLESGGTIQTRRMLLLK